MLGLRENCDPESPKMRNIFPIISFRDTLINVHIAAISTLRGEISKMSDRYPGKVVVLEK